MNEPITLEEGYHDLGACPARVTRMPGGSIAELKQCGVWYEQLTREFPSAELAIVKTARWTVIALWEEDIESSEMDSAFEAALLRSVDWDEISLCKLAREAR